jgi:hypothetical protein
MFTDAASVLGAVPDPGDTLSQLPPDVVEADDVQFSVPPPVLVMEMFWGAGLLPPAVALKVSEDGLRPMVGDEAGEMNTEAKMLCGELVAPPTAVIVTWKK